MLQGQAVDCADLVFYVLGVAWLAGELAEPFDEVVDDGKGVLRAVDHVEDIHLDLLFLAVGSLDAHGGILVVVLCFFCHGRHFLFSVFPLLYHMNRVEVLVFILYKETRGLALMYIL